jgi:transposase
VPSIAGSCSHIIEHSDALWTFLARDGVDPTNNHAERELRGSVLWRKTTLGSNSARGCVCRRAQVHHSGLSEAGS